MLATAAARGVGELSGSHASSRVHAGAAGAGAEGSGQGPSPRVTTGGHRLAPLGAFLLAVALLGPRAATAQAIELADVALGRGGFLLRGDGEPGSKLGGSLAPAGDVNGDGLEDILVGGPPCRGASTCRGLPTFVVFGRPAGPVINIDVTDFAEKGGGFEIRGIEESDAHGTSFSGAGDVNGDGLDDVLIGAWLAHPDGRPEAGEAYLVLGKPDGSPVRLADVRAGIGGFVIRGAAAGDRAGSSVSGCGDLNGDGLADLLIGAPWADPRPLSRPGDYPMDRAGEVYVLFGKRDREPVELAQVRTGRGGYAMQGHDPGVQAGGVVAAAGDVNGDGLCDSVIGAPGAAPQGGPAVGVGELHVVFGAARTESFSLGEIRAGRGGFVIRGSVEIQLGSTVAAAGDVNGDGLADILTGWAGVTSDNRVQAGEAYVVLGKADTAPIQILDVQAGVGGFRIRGRASQAFAASALAGVGDVNGDGLADLQVGTDGFFGDSSESYVVFGKRENAPVDLADLWRGRGGFLLAGRSLQGGAAAAGVGDVDGDGLSDFWIGGWGRERSFFGHVPGEAYLVPGRSSTQPVWVSSDAPGDLRSVIRGRPARTFSGQRVATAGDVDGDGVPDLWVHVGPTRAGVGVSYIVFGNHASGTIDLRRIEAGDGGFAIFVTGQRGAAITSFAGAGDVNGDGMADLLLGASGREPDGPPIPARAYVVFGKTDSGAVDLAAVEAGQGGFVILAAGEQDLAGDGAAGAGDVNGDGLADILIAAPSSSRGESNMRGETYVVLGKRGTDAVRLADVRAGAGGFVILPDDPGNLEGWGGAGSSVAGLGDVDGDGLADIGVGTWFTNRRVTSGAAECHVVLGKRDTRAVRYGELRAGVGGFSVRDLPRWFGSIEVSRAGDVNGDGLDDVFLGAPETDLRYLVLGKADTARVEIADLLSGLGGFVIRGVPGRSAHGPNAFAGAGDVNGDGLADLLVADSGWDEALALNVGLCHVVLGKADTSAVDLSDVRGGLGGFVLRGSGPFADAGRSVAGAGDVNGDGLADVLITANLLDTPYPSVSGATYLVYGVKAAPAPSFHRGAVRGRVGIDISDAIGLLGYLFDGGGPEPACLDAADTDDNGQLDVSDAVRLLGYLFLGHAAPPAPGPASCGLDSTPDRLGCARATEGCAG